MLDIDALVFWSIQYSSPLTVICNLVSIFFILGMESMLAITSEFIQVSKVPNLLFFLMIDTPVLRYLYSVFLGWCTFIAYLPTQDDCKIYRYANIFFWYPTSSWYINLCTLDMHYGSISLPGSNIVNPSVLSKTRLNSRFG